MTEELGIVEGGDMEPRKWPECREEEEVEAAEEAPKEWTLGYSEAAPLGSWPDKVPPLVVCKWAC